MKTVQEWLVLVILFCDVHSYPDLRCPYPSERRFRSRWVCNGVSTEKYTCLYNAIKKTHEESCKFKPVISGEGNEYHISVYPDPVSCQNLQRYQPFRLRSNMSSECVLLKSTCSDEGQYLFYHGSSTNDHRCGCDFQKGFGFVHKVERQCDCFPSKEDCSCYMKKNKCLPGFKLSSDYTCIHEDNKTHISKCPGIGPDRARNDTQHCRLYSKNKTDHNGARIFKLVASILTVICIIYVICVFALLLTNKVPKCLIQVISPPFNLKACQEGCFVKLSWSKKPEKSPTNRIQEFKIYYTHNDNWDGHQHKMVAADILHYYFSKLLPTKTYRFKVAACLNNLVESKCSEEETFVTRLPVEPPYFNAYKHNVEDNGNSCSVLLKWSAPGDTLIDIDNYSIRITTNNWETCEEKLLPWDIYEYVIQNAQQHAHYLFEIVSISNEVCSIPLKRIYSTKHDTYQCGAEFDVGYMNASMDRFKAEVHKLFTDKFNGIPGVQTLQETLLSKGSIILEFTFTSEGFDDEKVLHDTLKNAFKAGVIGPWEINLKKFWFKRLHDPQPPQHVTASSINDGVLVSWTVPPSTIFNTKEYIVEFSRNNWISKEEIYVSADKNKYFISKVLPSTTLYVKVYTCICHSIRSSPSREVSQFVGGPTPPEKIEVTAIEDTLKVSWIEPRHPVLEFVKDYKILIEEGDNIICETVRKDKSPFLKQYCQPFTNYKVRIVTCTVNGVESEPSQVVETKTKDFSKTEKENFLRLSGLLRNIAYRVVKERFDKVYPASDRGKLFEQNKHTLKSHLTEDQINQFLEQTNEGNFENMNFDMHQLLVLFLCLKGWQFTKKHRNKSPTDEDSSEISDLNRIETCLTHLEERNDNKISSKKFESLWNDVSPAIIRLGGDKYKSWCEGLRVNQTLKQENQETYKVDEISQSSSTEIDKLNRENLTEINQKYLEQVKERQNKQEENMEYLNQTQKSLQTEVETIKKDNASLNVCPDSHQIMIKRWKEDNERFNSRGT